MDLPEFQGYAKKVDRIRMKIYNENAFFRRKISNPAELPNDYLMGVHLNLSHKEGWLPDETVEAEEFATTLTTLSGQFSLKTQRTARTPSCLAVLNPTLRCFRN